MHSRHREVKPSEFFYKSRHAPRPHVDLYMLLLAAELYKGGEHAYDLLIVSVSMSIQNCEKTGSTPILKIRQS